MCQLLLSDAYVACYFLKDQGIFLLGCGWQQLTLVEVVNISKIFYPISCWTGIHFSLHRTEVVVVLLLRLSPLAHQSYPQVLSYIDVSPNKVEFADPPHHTGSTAALQHTHCTYTLYILYVLSYYIKL